ncbi:DUF2589 domain-containing protein [Flavobacterium sp. '19STA2R22 D10 B1']|uniref:DUF2589 domain-containing protein n=1 Tax=Flavobacterium aerium TaxID=3037261 RepID=UPI00278BC3D2|nr:DUF2589 domain-containing protein [Flavobacterium sp. '19STA2R22 D10 B1']
MNIANQFKGLPMEDLIGGPLSAAVKSNVDLAKSTAAFINDIGFEQIKGEDGILVPGPARMVDFMFERPGIDKDGNATVEEVKMKVPMLAIVPIPNLQVDLVDITFDMEVKSSVKSVDKSASEGKFSASLSAKIGFFTINATVSGAVSASKENTRSSDKSAKYHVEVKATNHGMPEGLSRVLDIMNDAAKPRQVIAYKPNENGEIARGEDGKPTDKGTLVNADGTPANETPKE